MTAKDLKTKYPHSRTSVAINAAIRAELPGGAEVLEAMNVLLQSGSNRFTDKALELMQEARAAMILEIRRRYGLPEREERNDAD